ncbi:hypothetical protein SLEP1_g8507 [Rubroshorea leprosula]|uniref:Uncharacterized protein n=1 Tax=Rubroshorea leprosula TaxID=152421 RepID=A0AAV5I1V8_9ROSI|nr:hypothetical protein SLEP1_g8507 [Rubroshorea leprosula]
MEEMQIQVRTLTGESTLVNLPADKAIGDLKLVLKNSFPPASSSPNFHLFFKGAKTSLNSKVSSLCIEPGEFFVLVPFTKKERPQTERSGFSVPSANPSNLSTTSSFADSAYSDMMQEFSSLREGSINSSGDNEGRGGTRSVNNSTETKRKGEVEGKDNDLHPYEFLLTVSRFPDEDILGEQSCQKFVEVLGLMNCLSNPHSRQCMLLTEANLHIITDGGLYTKNSGSCLCPAWLKKIMEAFAFLSIFSALLQLRRKKITLLSLRGVLERLGKFGIEVAMEDVENLSILCPKVICFVNDETEPKGFSGALVIIRSSTEERNESEDKYRTGQKGVSLSKIVSTMKKWEVSFKTSLCESIKLFMSNNKNVSTVSFSLEDLLIFVKEGGAVLRGNEAKRKKNWSTASSSHSVKRRCYEKNQFLAEEMVEHLRNGIGSEGQMVHVETIQARKATYVEIPDELLDNTKSALRSIGISKFYSHQAESISASLSGKNVVVATMTSSGKSICYNVPVLKELCHNPSSCALYLFPTKALAQDQLRALLSMIRGFDASINIGVYDGDTSQKDRTLLRGNARLLITNPDMLHMSILPLHRQFSRILSNLRFVVIDEAHTYKGAFGCHTALILRRLRRLCSHVYGAEPSFIFSTATSANPREHCMELASLSTLELIENDGSPSSQKLFILWNPSVQRTVPDKIQNAMDTGNASDKSLSPISEISNLFAEMVQHGLRCIAFCRSRKLCELVLCYTREILKETAAHLVDSICAYRGGYVAEERRRIESDIFGGKLCGIAATNALELGIDVGHIDVTLHLGFPGSIASLWQQAGRSGRRERSSLAVYVAFEGPLDQYFMKYPEKLFRGPIECCHIDAQNEHVLEQHLVCAALEHPLNLVHDEKYFGSGLNSAIISLKNKGYICSNPSGDSSTKIWSYIGQEKTPSRAISIRAIEAERYKVIETRRDEILEEIEESKAFFQVYEGAVYMHQGRTYLVKDLDISKKIAFCEEADLKYYTKTRDYTDIHIIGGKTAYPARVSKDHHTRTTAQANTCKVTTTWFGFRRIWRGSNIVFDTVDLSLPSYSYESQAVWISVSQSVKTEVEKNFLFRAGLHAACHALLHVVPLYMKCNSSDLAPECPNPYEARFVPERILLYDQHPGGTGVSKQIQPYFTELLGSALELLTCCRCSGDTGCPNCVQNLACGEYNELISKDAAIMIIKDVLDAEKSYFEGLHDSESCSQ